MRRWSLTSWQSHPLFQGIQYPDQKALEHVVQTLKKQPALVAATDIDSLKHAIAQARTGDVFLLQGGDCAEAFSDCQPDIIKTKVSLLENMARILNQRMQKPIIKIGRIAGQFAKSRSASTETREGITLPNYRGDLINGIAFTKTDRTPDPERLLQGYFCALRTLSTINETGADLYTSHEALHLQYEQALTRKTESGQWYDLSTHLPWVGVRTATPDSAHIEFLRGIHNPIGIKVGPNLSPEKLLDLLDCLDPNHEPGRIMLITRFGSTQVEVKLPALLLAVQTSNHPVTWVCDPMHGNTALTGSGFKTRAYDDILSEIQLTSSLHKSLGSCLGGLHIEMTGEHVTECIGGTQGLRVADLCQAYRSLVDPRLNGQQAMDMAKQLSEQW